MSELSLPDVWHGDTSKIQEKLRGTGGKGRLDKGNWGLKKSSQNYAWSSEDSCGGRWREQNPSLSPEP